MTAADAALYASGGLVSYLLGAAPFGLLAGLLLKGIDIRGHGSGNIGATNAMRVLGTPIGIAVHVLDIGKGFAASFALARLFAGGTAAAVPALGIGYGSAAIVGHVFPVYLRFHGGKGMATTFGAFVGLAWLPTLIAAAVWLVLAVAFRYASVASMMAVVTIPISMAVVPDPFAAGRRSWCKAELIVCGVAVAVLVLVRHKGNIIRLLHGTEHKGTHAAK